MEPVNTAAPAPDAGQTPAAPAQAAGQSIKSTELILAASVEANRLTLAALASGIKVTDATVKGLLPAAANVIACDLLKNDHSVPKALAVLCDKKELKKYRGDRKVYLRANTGMIHGHMLDEGTFIDKLSPWHVQRNGDAVRTITVRKPHVKVIEVTKTSELIETIKRARIAQMTDADRIELETAMKGLDARTKTALASSEATAVSATVVSQTPDPAPLVVREM